MSSYSGTPQGLNNTRLAKSSNYTVANGDKGSTIALGGNAFFTLTFNAASGYDSNFIVLVLNEDVYSGPGSGRGKTIACNGLSNFILWPGQSVIIFNSNNVWQVSGMARWRITTNPTFYADVTNGNDANDGLATGAGNAVQTLNRAVVRIAQQQCDYTVGAVVTIQLADGTYTGGLHLAGPTVGGTGHASLRINGNSSTPSNVVVAGPGSDVIIGLFDNARLEIQNLLLQDSTATACLSCDTGGVCRIETGVIFGNIAGNGIQIQVINDGGVICDTGYSVSGFPALVSSAASGFHIRASTRGYYTLGGQTVTFTASGGYTTTVDAEAMSTVIVEGTWSVGGNTITGQRYSANDAGAIISAGSGATFLPGNSAGATARSGIYT